MNYEKKHEKALEELKQCARLDVEPAKTILKLFPELEESDYVIERRLLCLLDYFRSRGIDHTICGRIQNWIKKQGEQSKQDNSEVKDYNDMDPHFGKPIGEVGLWFAVGDWVAANHADFRSPVKIVDISDTEYRIEDTKGNSGVPKIDYFNRHYHLWSIADAKDGDVLISACNQPFIYNGYNDSFYVGSYGGIAAAGGFKVSVEECRWTENISIHPATKEQQNYLFQKMKEAGYMWDSYTKSVFCSTNM